MPVVTARTKQWLLMMVFGLLSWAVPFAVSVLLYSPAGEPLYDIFLVKSILIVVGGTTGALLLVVYFRGITENYLAEGAVAGTVWLLMNWTLDLVVLVPMSGMSLADYAAQIGLRYLLIPAIGIAIGAAAADAAKRRA
jgi:hypothetical protein